MAIPRSGPYGMSRVHDETWPQVNQPSPISINRLCLINSQIVFRAPRRVFLEVVLQFVDHKSSCYHSPPYSMSLRPRIIFPGSFVTTLYTKWLIQGNRQNHFSSADILLFLSHSVQFIFRSICIFVWWGLISMNDNEWVSGVVDVNVFDPDAGFLTATISADAV
jgi:hypothetical protein